MLIDLLAIGSSGFNPQNSFLKPLNQHELSLFCGGQFAPVYPGQFAPGWGDQFQPGKVVRLLRDMWSGYSVFSKEELNVEKLRAVQNKSGHATTKSWFGDALRAIGNAIGALGCLMTGGSWDNGNGGWTNNTTGSWSESCSGEFWTWDWNFTGSGGSESGGGYGNEDGTLFINLSSSGYSGSESGGSGGSGWTTFYADASGYIAPSALLATTLGLNTDQATWLAERPSVVSSVNLFLETNYDALTYFEKVSIAKAHVENLISSPEYLEFDQAYPTSAVVNPLLIEVGKELAIEIGFKIIKKYLPGYGDLQSIKDAMQDASHGDWLGMLGEVINIVKKKVPALAVVDGVIDGINYSKQGAAVWKAFDKLKSLPSNAFNAIIKTTKNRCGGLLGKLEHDETLGSNSIQAIIKYDIDNAENFFREIAQDIGSVVHPTSSSGVFYFDVPGNFRFNFYPVSSSEGEPSIAIIFPGGGHYKFRFRP